MRLNNTTSKMIISSPLSLFFIIALSVETAKSDDYVKMKYSSGGYQPNWESLDSRPIPDWYDDVKFGIFIQWGVYSVPGASTEWFWYYWKSSSSSKEAKFINMTQPSEFTYQTYGPQLTAEFFNATQWAQIFKQSGAKYLVFSCKHHEGYTLWPSTRSFSWNSVDIGPHRDIVKEISEAVRKEDIRFGAYYSLFEWFNRLYLQDKDSNFTKNNFVKERVIPELFELVMTYKPELIWSDGDWEASDDYWQSKEFIAWLYNESPVKDTVVTFDRWGKGNYCKHGGVFTCTDHFNPKTIQKFKWENCMPVDKISWGYRKTMNIAEILSVHDLLTELVTTVSCGGNLLLNVGPTKEGTIPVIFQDRLEGIGKWMEINGEAIYETKPWKFQNDTINNDVWYTASKKHANVIYAILLKWPKEGLVRVKNLKPIPNKSTIQILGYQEHLKWALKGDITIIELPNLALMPSNIAWGMKIVFK